MTLLIVCCSLLGLVVGSFLNVVVYRVPRQLSIIRPRSACPSCHQPISERDNIPVLSWVLLRGRCRHCRLPISPRYPLVELSAAIFFPLTSWRIGPHLDLVAYLILEAALLALALIDLEHLLLPRAIVYPTLVSVAGWLLICAAYYGQWHRFIVAAACAVSWFLVFFVMNYLSPRSLGFGDVRLSPVLGLALGWFGVGEVLLGFFLSNLLGAVVGVSLIAAKKKSRSDPVPYGVYLAAGTILTVLVGPTLVFHFTHSLGA